MGAQVGEEVMADLEDVRWHLLQPIGEVAIKCERPLCDEIARTIEEDLWERGREEVRVKLRNGVIAAGDVSA